MNFTAVCQKWGGDSWHVLPDHRIPGSQLDPAHTLVTRAGPAKSLFGSVPVDTGESVAVVS